MVLATWWLLGGGWALFVFGSRNFVLGLFSVEKGVSFVAG